MDTPPAVTRGAQNVLVPAKSIKIAIVGAGSVGATTAYALLLSGLAAEIVLIDIDAHRAQGEATDMSHAAHFSPSSCRVRASSSYADCAGATAVVLTAGVNQKPGQTRLDLVRTNAALFAAIVPPIAAAAPGTVLVVATNPVDVLTHAAAQLSGFPPHRVVGTGTTLDSTRLRAALGAHFGVSPRSVHAMVVGEHGDSQLPAYSLATISGMRLGNYAQQAGIRFDDGDRDAIARKTRGAAYEIIRRKGKTNYGVASVLVSILEPIVTDGDAIMTVSRVGTYAGVEGVALSMPCRINRDGAHQQVPLLLDEEETQALRKSAASIKEVIQSL